jgi:hypothetical protein
MVLVNDPDVTSGTRPRPKASPMASSPTSVSRPAPVVMVERTRRHPEPVRWHRPQIRAVGLVLVAVLAAGCAGSADTGVAATAPAATDAPRPTVVVHRTEACACCGSYEDILAAAGFEVDQRMHDRLAPIRAELGVPEDQSSCHTLEVDGYAAEGHVPIEALDDLLTQRPEVDGIALAGMPLGSPGMPGEQEEPFVVELLRDGAVIGELGRY